MRGQLLDVELQGSPILTQGCCAGAPTAEATRNGRRIGMPMSPRVLLENDRVGELACTGHVTTMAWPVEIGNHDPEAGRPNLGSWRKSGAGGIEVLSQPTDSSWVTIAATDVLPPNVAPAARVSRLGYLGGAIKRAIRPGSREASRLRPFACRRSPGPSARAR